MIVALNVLSAVAAAMATFFWWKVASIKTPATKRLTVDLTNFDWLTKPLIDQSYYNRLGAGFAALAAFLQALSAVTSAI